MDRICIIRKQFPNCCNYGITIHKSQGLSLKNAVVEAGNEIFENGQTYVALSRVTSREGLHLINFDPSKIKACNLAIIEYNRLKKEFRPDLPQFNHVHIMSKYKIRDNKWVPEPASKQTNMTKNIRIVNDVKGIIKYDDFPSYVNVTLQCLFHCEAVRRVLSETKEELVLKQLFQSYVSADNKLNLRHLKQFVNIKYLLQVHYDVAEFLVKLISKQLLLQQILSHELTTILSCTGCKDRTVVQNKSNYMLQLILPRKENAYTLQEIFDYNFNKWITVPSHCEKSCKCQQLQRYEEIQCTNSTLIIKLLNYEDTDEQTLRKESQKINEVPKSIVNIKGKKFKVAGGIFHHGKNIPNGYYTNMLRINKQWVFVHDQTVRQKQWPKSSANVYIFFFEMS
ncbi:hypothetical protein TKK_0000118 [Trichogramma kaykai]|uniref:USP domain-containing protein n=1 Tax=Trichogramma kaykai TaxID=54128 RepID=A0ABD2W1R0_9HYME